VIYFIFFPLSSRLPPHFMVSQYLVCPPPSPHPHPISKQVKLLRAAREAYLLLAGSGLCGTLEGADFWCMPMLWKNAGVSSGSEDCSDWISRNTWFFSVSSYLRVCFLFYNLGLLSYLSGWSWSRRRGKTSLFGIINLCNPSCLMLFHINTNTCVLSTWKVTPVPFLIDYDFCH